MSVLQAFGDEVGVRHIEDPGVAIVFDVTPGPGVAFLILGGSDCREYQATAYQPILKIRFALQFLLF